MKQKLYVLVHINVYTSRRKDADVEIYTSLEDVQRAMRTEWEDAIEKLRDGDVECTDSELEEYRKEDAYIEEMCAGLPYGVDKDIETDEDYWQIKEIELPEVKKIIGYQLVSDKGEIPDMYTSYQIFRHKEDAEAYRNDYHATDFNVVPIYEGDIEGWSYISPITRHHKLEVGEKVCVIRHNCYHGWGTVTEIEHGVISVTFDAMVGLNSDNFMGGAWCSPDEVFQIVPNKNYDGMIVCYEQESENGNLPYFTPCDMEGHYETELMNGEPDWKNLV